MSAKDEVRTVLGALPETCTLEDIQYHLYVIEKVRNSEVEAARDGVIPHENVAERMKKWTSA